MTASIPRLLAGLALCAAASFAQAQSYPTKPIRWVVPYGPGSTDILARILAPKVGAALGQQIVVENRPGAGGSMGSEQVAKGAADGYTLLLGAAASHAVNPALYSKIGYDAVKDFAPIINLASIPNVVIVNPQVPYKTIPELVAAAKAQPGIITYSSNGAGTSQHMSAALFEMLTGVKMVHVPYKGSSEGVIAVTRGDVNVMFANLPPTLALIKDGRVKAIAVTTAKRLAAFPDLPTVAEAGVPGYEVSTWFALFGPAGTPEPVVQRLNREFAAALADHDTREKLLAQGFTLNGGSPQDLGALVRSELVKWARVVKESGAKVE
jgi:tripartite-type tricarboxylate transporter receptor subunit TctC